MIGKFSALFAVFGGVLLLLFLPALFTGLQRRCSCGSMSHHLRVLVGLLDVLTLKDAETWLANWLLKQCPRPLPTGPTVIQLDRTKLVLAAEMGTSSETLSRSLTKFRDQKLLCVTGRTITLTKPRELESLLQRNLARFRQRGAAWAFD